MVDTPSMKAPSRIRAITAGLQQAGPWILLAAVGILLQALAGVSDVPVGVAVVLTVCGALSALIGSAGIGVKIGRERADDLTRARMVPAFRRTLRHYQGLFRLENEITYARNDLVNRPTSSIPLKDAEAHLRALAVRVQEQETGADDAMDEWRLLVPEEVEKVVTAVRESVE